MKIGFIGLGTMGRHMASNLMTAGHELVVHDVRREATAPHREAGARWAETPRGVAEATDVVFQALDVGAKAIWLQSGIRSPEGKAAAEALINDDNVMLENSFVVPDAALADVPAAQRSPAPGAGGSQVRAM